MKWREASLGCLKALLRRKLQSFTQRPMTLVKNQSLLSWHDLRVLRAHQVGGDGEDATMDSSLSSFDICMQSSLQ